MTMNRRIITAAFAVLVLALLMFGAPRDPYASDETPDPDTCFPPEDPEPDGDCLQAITDLMLHGGNDHKWDSGSENFSVTEDGNCILTIDATDFTVTGYWTATPRTCGLSGNGHTLDIADGGSSFKVGWSVPDSIWQAVVRLDGNGLLAEGSETQ